MGYLLEVGTAYIDMDLYIGASLRFGFKTTVELFSVARVRPRISKGITDLLSLNLAWLNTSKRLRRLNGISQLFNWLVTFVIEVLQWRHKITWYLLFSPCWGQAIPGYTDLVHWEPGHVHVWCTTNTKYIVISDIVAHICVAVSYNSRAGRDKTVDYTLL